LLHLLLLLLLLLGRCQHKHVALLLLLGLLAKQAAAWRCTTAAAK
jgi:hypothetical protein